MREKKLLIVIGGMSRGGAERVISHISEYFAMRGWQVWIVMLLINKVDYVLHPNVQIVDLSGGTTSRWKRVPYWIFGLRRLMREICPDSVLSFLYSIYFFHEDLRSTIVLYTRLSLLKSFSSAT